MVCEWMEGMGYADKLRRSGGRSAFRAELQLAGKGLVPRDRRLLRQHAARVHEGQHYSGATAKTDGFASYAGAPPSYGGAYRPTRHQQTVFKPENLGIWASITACAANICKPISTNSSSASTSASAASIERGSKPGQTAGSISSSALMVRPLPRAISTTGARRRAAGAGQRAGGAGGPSTLTGTKPAQAAELMDIPGSLPARAFLSYP